MVITWLGTMAILLNKFWSSLFKIERLEFNYKDTATRYGVYYFCIEDFPL